MTRAFALSEASYVLAFDYLKLPFVAFIGFLLFSEVPSFWVWLGSAFIISSSIYLVNRDKVNKSQNSPTIKASSRTP